jgi:hypothetical protein
MGCFHHEDQAAHHSHSHKHKVFDDSGLMDFVLV